MFYKILYDKKSDLSNFKIINCQVWTFIFKKKCLIFDLKFNDCRLLEYAVSMQYILYEMNSDQIIYSCDVIFNESFKAEADYFSSDWIFNVVSRWRAEWDVLLKLQSEKNVIQNSARCQKRHLTNSSVHVKMSAASSCHIEIQMRIQILLRDYEIS